MTKIFYAFLVALLMVTGCGPVPKPFQHEGNAPGNDLVRLDDAAGVVIVPVDGLPDQSGGFLAAAIAAALRDQNVPASLGTANRSAKKLTGTVWAEPIRNGRQVLRFEWQVMGPDGAVLAELPQQLEVIAVEWERGDPGAYAFIGQKVAENLAAELLQDYGLIGSFAEPAPPRVVLWGIEGAPGDGNQTLRSAIIGALTNRQVEIYHDLTDDVPLLICAVTVKDVESQRGPAQQVSIDWVIMSANGEELGRMNQTNLVPKGRLEKGWGPIAFLAAEGVGDELAHILKLLAEEVKNP